MELTKQQEILKLIFKDFLTFYNSRSISKKIKISHVGAFKILKKLGKKELVNPKKIGRAIIYSINKENPLTLKEIEIILIIESQNYKRWIEEFKSIKEKAEFVILFGSILKKGAYARDIDLLVIAKKENFRDINKLINERQNFLNKKIHLILQSLEEFKQDLEKKNKTIMEIIRTGVVLFGQDKFIEVLK